MTQLLSCAFIPSIISGLQRDVNSKWAWYQDIYTTAVDEISFIIILHTSSGPYMTKGFYTIM